MSGFQHILFYSTGEQDENRIFKKVADLAHTYKAKLTIVDVVDLSPSLIQWLFQSTANSQAREVAETIASRRLKTLAESACKQGIDATADLLFGKPFVELVRTVVLRDCDLIVNTARSCGDTGERLFGSTALHLVRKCPIPVLIMYPKRNLKFSRILVPIDIRPEDPLASGVNAKIMDVALTLAESEGSELHFLHAWQAFGISLLSASRKIPREQLREYEASYEKAHRQRFDKFLSGYSFDHLKHRIHFVKGDPRVLIPEIAARYRVSLVVMGTITILGFAGSLIGSTAEEVIPQLKCSVLTVKPEGFVTPVKIE